MVGTPLFSAYICYILAAREYHFIVALYKIVLYCEQTEYLNNTILISVFSLGNQL